MAEKEVVDRSVVTVISVVSREIKSDEPGLRPNFYVIKAAAQGDIELLFIKEAKYDIYAGDKKYIEATEKPEIIAASIVNGYCNSQLALSDNCRPGIFWEYGDYTKAEAKVKFAARIEKARQEQRGWFTNLVTLADDDWQKFHLHTMISQLQRDACAYLGFEREWLVFIPTGENKKMVCPACQSEVSPLAVLCGHCKVILKPEEYKKLQFATA